MLEGLLAIFVAQLSGSTLVPVFTKIGLHYLPPITFVFFRFFFAAIIFFFFFLFNPKKKSSIKKYGHLLLLAGFLWTNVTLFTIGVQFTTVIMSQILYTATPIIVGILAHFFLNEKITHHKLIGLFIALLGVCFLLYQSAAKQDHITFGSPLGNILIIIGMLGYSGWVLYSRKLANKHEFTSSQTTFFTFIFIALYNFFLLPFQQYIVPNLHAAISFTGLMNTAIVAAGSAILYFFMQVGIKKTSAFTASLFQYLGPFFSGLVTVPLLHERISPLLIIGGLLILFGVFYATTLPVLYVYLSKRKHR